MTRPTDRRRGVDLTLGTVLALLTALLVSSLALAPRAEAFIYWTNTLKAKNSIGRANLKGTRVEQKFIKTHAGNFNDIAVNDRHIYWTYRGTDTIGRARLDGTGVDPRFIRARGALYCYPRVGGCAPVYLAVDSDHIYWTTYREAIGGIGRAKLDGTGVDADFISGISLGRLAVGRDRIYWAGVEPPPGPGFDTSRTTIGRAKLDGTGVDDGFISELHGVDDVAVDHDHIYWTQVVPEFGIGRARIDGTGANESFITSRAKPSSVAADDKHVYWTSAPNRKLARASLNGTHVKRSYIDGISGYGGLAVDSRGR